MAATVLRTEREVERDHILLADWYMRGWTHLQMADELNARFYVGRELTRRMISYDVQKIIKRWREKAVGDVGIRKAEELARIDRLENEYWNSWEKSREPRMVLTKAGEEVEITPDGNPEFLRGTQWCIEQRCKIFGLYAPIRSNVSFGNLNDNQLIAYVKEQLGELGILPSGDEQAQVVFETEDSDD